MRIGIRLTGAMSRLDLEENASWAAEHGFALDASQDADAGADLVDDRG